MYLVSVYVDEDAIAHLGVGLDVWPPALCHMVSVYLLQL